MGPVGIGCPLDKKIVDAVPVNVGIGTDVRAGKIALAASVTVVSGESSCAMTVAKKAETNSEANIISECVGGIPKSVLLNCSV